MEGKGRKRRVDRSDGGQVGQPRNPRIGIIGRPVLNADEKRALRYLGRCVALLGHSLVFIPTKGTADQLREGVEAEGGVTHVLESDVIGNADHTLIYPDKRLLTRLLATYPNLNENENVTIIEETNLNIWIAAVTQLLTERGITPPAR